MKSQKGKRFKEAFNLKKEMKNMKTITNKFRQDILAISICIQNCNKGKLQPVLRRN